MAISAKSVHLFIYCINKRKSNSTDTFLLDEWSKNQNTTKSGPSSAQQQNAGGAIIAQYGMLA